jgi:hypothetical protein
MVNTWFEPVLGSKRSIGPTCTPSVHYLPEDSYFERISVDSVWTVDYSSVGLNFTLCSKEVAMQLEVGKNYVTRSGEIVEIVDSWGLPGQPPATFGATHNTADYYADGRRLWQVDGPNDIVAYLPFRFYHDGVFPWMFAVCDDGTNWWIDPKTGGFVNQSDLLPEQVVPFMNEVIPHFKCEVVCE